jgi:hypothetical protein
MKQFLFFFSILVLVFSHLAHAKVQSAKLAVDVPSGRWKAIRLRDLPESAAVKVKIKSDGPVVVALVDETKYENYPDIERPLFQGNVHDKFTFSVKIPSAGHYYLIFNNISGIKEVKLDAIIYGASGPDAVSIQKSHTEDKEDDLEKNLNQIGMELKKLFLFEPFPISAKICGNGNVFSGPDGIVICLEFVKKITNSLGSKEKSVNVLLFTIFHEVGHILLKQWEYPFYDNEEVADDFATVLMIMIGQKELLGAMTEYFVSSPSLNELMAKTFHGDRHQLSIERARNIIRWMKEPNRFIRWQTIFIPHMHTSVLEHLKENSTSSVNISLIEKELTARKHSD